MKTYTKKEIADLLGCSARTIAEDIKHLKVKPIENGDYNASIYSEFDYSLIEELRDHCSSGGTRVTFIPSSPVEIVRPKVSKLIPKECEENSIRTYLESNPDPLADLQLLQRVSDNKWLLPTKRIAAIINVKVSTLLRQKQYNYCGFICTKEIFASKTFLWKVEANNS